MSTTNTLKTLAAATLFAFNPLQDAFAQVKQKADTLLSARANGEIDTLIIRPLEVDTSTVDSAYQQQATVLDSMLQAQALPPSVDALADTNYVQPADTSAVAVQDSIPTFQYEAQGDSLSGDLVSQPAAELVDTSFTEIIRSVDPNCDSLEELMVRSSGRLRPGKIVELGGQDNNTTEYESRIPQDGDQLQVKMKVLDENGNIVNASIGNMETFIGNKQHTLVADDGLVMFLHEQYDQLEIRGKENFPIREVEAYGLKGFIAMEEHMYGSTGSVRGPSEVVELELKLKDRDENGNLYTAERAVMAIRFADVEKMSDREAYVSSVDAKATASPEELQPVVVEGEVELPAHVEINNDTLNTENLTTLDDRLEEESQNERVESAKRPHELNIGIDGGYAAALSSSVSQETGEVPVAADAIPVKVYAEVDGKFVDAEVGYRVFVNGNRTDEYRTPSVQDLRLSQLSGDLHFELPLGNVVEVEVGGQYLREEQDNIVVEGIGRTTDHEFKQKNAYVGAQLNLFGDALEVRGGYGLSWADQNRQSRREGAEKKNFANDGVGSLTFIEGNVDLGGVEVEARYSTTNNLMSNSLRTVDRTRTSLDVLTDIDIVKGLDLRVGANVFLDKQEVSGDTNYTERVNFASPYVGLQLDVFDLLRD